MRADGIRFSGQGLNDGGGSDDLLCPTCGGTLIKGFYSLLRGGSLAVLRWAERSFSGCQHHR